MKVSKANFKADITSIINSLFEEMFPKVGISYEAGTEGSSQFTGITLTILNPKCSISLCTHHWALWNKIKSLTDKSD